MGHGLRRRAASVEPIDDGYDRLGVSYLDSGAIAEEIASYGSTVVVEEPATLRQAVIERLVAVVGSHGELEAARTAQPALPAEPEPVS